MCSIAGAGLAITALGGLGSLLGGRNQADAIQAGGTGQAAILRRNAARFRTQAVSAIADSRQENFRDKLKGLAAAGASRTAAAASGFAVNSGSFRNIRASDRFIGRIQSHDILMAGVRRADGFNLSSENSEFHANVVEATARRKAAGKRSTSTTSFFSVLGGVASKWGKFNDSGVSIFGDSSSSTGVGQPDVQNDILGAF